MLDFAHAPKVTGTTPEAVVPLARILFLVFSKSHVVEQVSAKISLAPRTLGETAPSCSSGFTFFIVGFM